MQTFVCSWSLCRLDDRGRFTTRPRLRRGSLTVHWLPNYGGDALCIRSGRRPLRGQNSASAPFGLAVLVAPRVFYRLPPELAAAAPLRSAPPSRSSRPLRYAPGTLIVVRESLLVAAAPFSGPMRISPGVATLPLRVPKGEKVTGWRPFMGSAHTRYNRQKGHGLATLATFMGSAHTRHNRRKGHGLAPVHGLCPYPP